MAVQFETAFRSGIIALAIAGGGAAFLVMGVAAVSWRAQCEANPKAGVCFLSADPTPVQTSSLVAKRANPIAEPQPVVEAPAVEQPALLAATVSPPPAEFVAEPAPAADQQMVAAAEMMSSTFQTLSVLSAQINGSDPAPDPLQTAVTASVEDAVAATPVTAALPTPDPLGPTKRTVKLIPVSPTGTPVSSAATAAIDAAEQDDQPRAIAMQQVAAVEPDPALEPMAFATAPVAVPAGTPARVLEVDDNLVNVRSGPSTKSEKLWVLKRGDEVQALAVAGDWVQVQISDGKVGWMLGEFLDETNFDGLPRDEQVAVVVDAPVAPAAEPVVVDDTVAAAAPGGDLRRVTGGGVNVRASASSSGEKIFTLGPGEQVTVTETERGWLKIIDDQGRTGWLYEDFVTGV